jgi:nicotinate phosphoribosyltransferase
LNKAFITVSNDLDESIIETLVKEGAPVDSWGVGTRMVTGNKDAAFTGVYKLTARLEGNSAVPVMKFSDNPEKTTNPGVKQVWRIRDQNGDAVADVLGVDDGKDKSDEPEQGRRYRFWHPSADYRHFYHTVEGSAEALLKKRIENGVLVKELPPLAEVCSYSASDLERFDSTYKRLLNPHVYKVSITEKLRGLKLELIKKLMKNEDLVT